MQIHLTSVLKSQTLFKRDACLAQHQYCPVCFWAGRCPLFFTWRYVYSCHLAFAVCTFVISDVFKVYFSFLSFCISCQCCRVGEWCEVLHAGNINIAVTITTPCCTHLILPTRFQRCTDPPCPDGLRQLVIRSSLGRAWIGPTIPKLSRVIHILVLLFNPVCFQLFNLSFWVC